MLLAMLHYVRQLFIGVDLCYNSFCTCTATYKVLICDDNQILLIYYASSRTVSMMSMKSVAVFCRSCFTNIKITVFLLWNRGRDLAKVLLQHNTSYCVIRCYCVLVSMYNREAVVTLPQPNGKLIDCCW